MLINTHRAIDMQPFQVPSHLAKVDFANLIKDKQRRLFVLTNGRKLHGTLVGHCALMLFILPQPGDVPYQIFTAEVQEILLAPGSISLGTRPSTPSTAIAYPKQHKIVPKLPAATTHYWTQAQPQRYYAAQLTQDLLGDWVLTKAWGSTTKRGGRVVNTAYTSHESALSALAKLNKIRVKRGYAAQMANRPT